MSAGWVEDVLHFWFSELSETDWWQSTPALDEAIRARFAAVHASVMAMPVDQLTSTPETALAGVIVLDQFSRNMFRRTAAAFASDAKAHAIAEAAVTAGYDQGLSVAQRIFLYLPFEHAEDHAAQAKSVALFTALGDPKSLEAAIAHKVIFDRFSRYPHRNAVLGRVDTAEEAAYLAGDIKRYGQ